MFVPSKNKTKKTINKTNNKYLKKYWAKKINQIRQLKTAGSRNKSNKIAKNCWFKIK